MNFLPNGLGWHFQSEMTDMIEESEEVVEGVEELVREYRNVGQADTALYWADKLVSLGQGSS